MLDILLAIGAAASQGVTSYLGWRLIASPLDPADVKRKKLYEAAFIILVILGIAAVGITAYRGQDMNVMLNKIEKNTENKSPQVVVLNVAPPSTPAPERPAGFLQAFGNPEIGAQLEDNKPIKINLAVVNKTGDVLYGVHNYFGAALAVVGNDPEKIDRESYSRFVKMFRAQLAKDISEHKSGDSVAPNEVKWSTVTTAPIPLGIIPEILNGQLRLYAFSWARWNGSSHDLEVCRWLQKPENEDLTQGLIWHTCSH